MKNYELLMSKINTLLKPDSDAKLFVHIFAHKDTPYDFETGWMTEHFFTGGTMPSADLLLYFQQQELKVERQWWVSGKHYARTCEDWLAKMNAQREGMWEGLKETYARKSGPVGKVDETVREREAWRWFYRWQVFYMACAELFAFGGGEEWGVVQYLFEKR